jgi:hypothetical protein
MDFLESGTPQRMPARKQYGDAWDIMRLRLPPGTFARIDKVRGSETKTELLRRALEGELQRREAGLKKPDTTKKKQS